MQNTKPKVLICPQCGSGMPPRRKGKHCIDCTKEEEKKFAVKMQIKKINITQKKKPKPKAKHKPARKAKQSQKSDFFIFLH